MAEEQPPAGEVEAEYGALTGYDAGAWPGAMWPGAGGGGFGGPSVWLMPAAAAGPAPPGPPSEELLPKWLEDEELENHQRPIMEFRTTACEDFRRGYCAKHRVKGKASQCFAYHFDSQARRCPIQNETRKLKYWDAQCPHWSLDATANYCPNGEACPFAHGRDEVSHHPAKYKTRLCNGHECRGEAICCFAHSDEELRTAAPERYSYMALVLFGNNQGGGASKGSRQAKNAGADVDDEPRTGGQPQKQRFCAAYPNVSQCRRGAACAFAHCREEVQTPLLTEAEERHAPEALSQEGFFTEKFKTLWCPIGAQHDWQSCVYAHTYQDARRKPSIGYGPQPCPFWSKKDTRLSYLQRCPLGLRCPYSHGAKEQLYHPKYFRTVVCRDLQMKGCPRQRLCAFFHKRSEKCNPGADDIDYNAPLPKTAIAPDWSAYFLAPPFFQESTGANDGGPGMATMGGGADSWRTHRAGGMMNQMSQMGAGMQWYDYGAAGAAQAAAAQAAAAQAAKPKEEGESPTNGEATEAAEGEDGTEGAQDAANEAAAGGWYPAAGTPAEAAMWAAAAAQYEAYGGAVDPSYYGSYGTDGASGSGGWW